MNAQPDDDAPRCICVRVYNLGDQIGRAHDPTCPAHGEHPETFPDEDGPVDTMRVSIGDHMALMSEVARLRKQVTELQEHATRRREAMMEAKWDAIGYREAAKRLATCFGAFLKAEPEPALDALVEEVRAVSESVADGGGQDAENAEDDSDFVADCATFVADWVSGGADDEEARRRYDERWDACLGPRGEVEEGDDAAR